MLSYDDFYQQPENTNQDLVLNSKQYYLFIAAVMNKVTATPIERFQRPFSSKEKKKGWALDFTVFTQILKKYIRVKILNDLINLYSSFTKQNKCVSSHPRSSSSLITKIMIN